MCRCIFRTQTKVGVEGLTPSKPLGLEDLLEVVGLELLLGQ